MFTEDLKQIKAIANAVGFKRSGDSNGYLNFVEEEAAKERAKIDSIVSETNRTMRELEAKKRQEAVRAERRRLQKEATPEIYGVVPRMTIDKIPKGITQEQVAEALKRAIAQFKAKIDITKGDFEFLLNVMSVNEVNATDARVWERVLDWAIRRLTLIETGGPVPEKQVEVVPEEEKNPYAFSSHPQSAYAQWEKEHLQDQVYAEFMPVVRETLEPIIKNDSRDFEAASIRHLIETLRKKNLVINRNNIRAEFLRIWGKESNPESLRQSFTEQELSDWKNDLEDRYLSSAQIKAKYVHGVKI